MTALYIIYLVLCAGVIGLTAATKPVLQGETAPARLFGFEKKSRVLMTVLMLAVAALTVVLILL